MSKYASFTSEQLEEHFSNFLMDSWSFSKAASFARNEKEFERSYIYRERSKSPASQVAGNAYHSALAHFFTRLSQGEYTSLIDMQKIAFAYIEDTGANQWKLQKTTPTVEECRIKATQLTVSLLDNFTNEQGIYLSDLKEVVAVESRFEEWVTINGVDIPLPCHAIIDLVVKLNDGKTVIIDHKSKSQYTDDEESAFVIGKQAITYAKVYEQNTGDHVDEVWFIENKTSKNKDGKPQLKKIAVTLDADTRRLYESMLYDPLKRMIEAVSDPDYVFTINDSDTMASRAELYDFWCRTMIAEIEEFNVQASKKELIEKRMKKVRDASIKNITPNVISIFKKKAKEFIQYDFTNSDMTNIEKIEHVLRTFGIIVRVAHEIDGFSSNTYLLEVSAGVKIANIAKYQLDIANALNVSSVRMGTNLMVHNEKSYVGIEVSKKRTKDLLFDPKYLDGQNIPIGVDNFGNVIRWNINNHSTPHMLICGATGSGKSVSIISTIEYARLAGINDIVIFDPKYEFTEYAKGDIRVYNEIEDIEEQMKLLVEDMQIRAKNRENGTHRRTLVVFDEFADAVASSRSGNQLNIIGKIEVEGKSKVGVTGKYKSLEENMKMLLQKGRSLGFRVIAATQRASVQVITGDAKVNFPVQICFRVPKEIDSKVVLDEVGAESLSGAGDGLMRSPEYLDIVRFQGFYKAK